MRIGRRLLLTYIVVAVVAVLAAGAVLYDTLGDEARAGVEERVATGVRMLAVGLVDASADPVTLDARVDGLALAADARLTIVAPDGRVLADSEFDGAALAALDNHNSRVEVRQARATGQGRSVRASRSVGADLLYRARLVSGGPWAGSVARMAVPLSRVEAAKAAARRELAGALLLALALASAAGAFWARRISRPIAELARMAARVEAGDVTARARVDTGDELEDLARALEAANDRLAARIDEATAGRDRLEGVLEGMAEGVLVTDREGRVVLANTALQSILGLVPSPIGRTVIEAVRQPEMAAALREAAGSGNTVSREVTITWPHEKTLRLHAAGLPGGGGVGVLHDITALVRVDRVRRDFVANVSHELRTPLATISGYAEALGDPASDAAPDPAEVRDSAAIIRRNVVRLTAIVADLLELSRLEAEGFSPQIQPLEVPALIGELAAEWSPRAEARGLVLAAEAEPGLTLRADLDLLLQALGNLIENAVKYCPPGARVRLTATAAADAVVFTVADTGPGIPYDDQPRVFERFYRVDKGRARATGGTGLGLSIVKHVAEAHGGRVDLESNPGAGTSFRLTIPQSSDSSQVAAR